MGWLDAASGYQVRLGENGRVHCRNGKGKQLSSVPAAIKDDPQVVQLRQLSEWLTRHAAECLSTVDEWMVRSLPVPTAVLTEVWADPAWSDALRDLVVTVPDGGDAETGFLRDADPERGLGLVTLDGDTVRLRPETVSIPHPVLLDDLAELREFGAELGVEQRVQQLFRQTFERPAAFPTGRTSVDDYSGGKFEQVNHVLSRCRTLGYPVRGGDAVYSAFEGGRTLEARYWIGVEYPEGEAWTGDLRWIADGAEVPLAEVGPVAWSEGLRMAAAIYSARVVEEAQVSA
ncbi:MULTISPECIES: DUF4132 domain-containing protein [Actinoalloteichus]|uniref:DUF4132 family protein n=1 Tax=Actinoalloteichus fjordicus TaxID=1612552 RepID=A0AAC9LFH6_9PSEU|nr:MULTISPECIES: DUF4132 domain-containing protein [Actinoalloteichus]APU15909.1 putative DUF4132 family protein [Actinoalloteichus fjordicus]APU21971.1 putative DUF4132 family protein [Actinoalloteichus sp. GBA129-24]